MKMKDVNVFVSAKQVGSGLSMRLLGFEATLEHDDASSVRVLCDNEGRCLEVVEDELELDT